MNFKKGTSEAVVSLLGEGVEIVGEVSFTQGVKIDGAIKGNVRSDASLVIGSKGRIEADVSVRRISIGGEFRGTIYASERVEILREGKVFGDLYTPCLIIEAGAIFEGKCNMSKTVKSEEGALLKVVETPNDGTKAAGNEKTWAKRSD
jgi:cytoskeletal protein CcmA (bactofilin family)